MKHIITILIIISISILSYVPVGTAGGSPSVKQQMIDQMAPNAKGPVQPTEIGYCDKKLIKYKKRIKTLKDKKDERELTIGEKWSYSYNKERLKYWTDFCAEEDNK